MSNPESIHLAVDNIEAEILSAAEADLSGTIVPLRYINSFPLANRVDSSSQAFYNNLPFVIIFKALQIPDKEQLTGQLSYQSFVEFKTQEGIPSLHLKTISLYNFLVDEYPGGLMIPGENASGFDAFTGLRGIADFFPLMAFLLELESGEEEFLEFKTMPELLEHYRQLTLEQGLGIPFSGYLISGIQAGVPLRKPTTEDLSFISEVFKNLNSLLASNEKVDWFIDSNPDDVEAPIEKIELTLEEAKQLFLGEGFDFRRLGFGNSTFEMLEGEEGEQLIKQSLEGLITNYYFEKINSSEVAYSYLLNIIAELLESGEEDLILRRRIKMIYKQVVLERLLYCSIKEEKPSLLAKILSEKKINFHNLPRIGLEAYFEREGVLKGCPMSFITVFCTPQQAISEFQEAYSAFRSNVPYVSSTTFLMMILEPKPHDLVSYHNEITERMELLDYTDGHLLEIEDTATIFFNLVQPVGQNGFLVHMNEVQEEGLEGKGMFPIPEEMFYAYLDDLVNTSFSCIHLKKKDMLNMFGTLGQPDLKALYLNQQRLEGLFCRPIVRAIDRAVFKKEN